MWYILTSHLSLFDFSPLPLSFIHSLSLILLTPMTLEYGKQVVATQLYFLTILTHVLLTSLPHAPLAPNPDYPARCRLCLQRVASLPNKLNKALPYIWVIVGVNQFLYFWSPGEYNISLMLVFFYFALGMEVWLVFHQIGRAHV